MLILCKNLSNSVLTELDCTRQPVLPYPILMDTGRRLAGPEGGGGQLPPPPSFWQISYPYSNQGVKNGQKNRKSIMDVLVPNLLLMFFQNNVGGRPLRNGDQVV